MIRSITVENFKSIKNASLYLPKFGLIIGKNGSGKSTLLNAISLTQKLARGDSLTEALKGIAPLTTELFHFDAEMRSSKIEVKIESSKNTIFKFAYSLTIDNQTKKLIISSEELYRILDENNSMAIYKRVKDGVNTYPNNSEVFVPLKKNDDELSLGGISDPDVADIAYILSNYTIVDNAEKVEGVNVVSGEHPNLHTLDGVVVSLFNKNQIMFNEAVRATQQIIPEFRPPTIKDLTKFYSDNSIPIETVNENQEEASSPTTIGSETEGLKSYIVSWNETQYKQGYSSVSLSGGNIRTIYLIFSLFNTPNYSFFGVEEIENGMHSDRVSKLIDQFRTQSNNKKIQMLFTTHSLDLLNYVLPQEMIYCTKNAQVGSEYKRITDMEEYKVIREELGKKHITGSDIISSGLFS